MSVLVPPPVVVVAPNSYKGSVSATAAAAALSRGLARVWPDGERRICPMADGGEGTLDAIFSRGGRRGSARVSGASGAPIDAAFGLIEGDAIAVIESAQVVGLTEANGIATAVEQRSTRGLGELVRTLLDAGIRKFMIGLGGSSTNDAGAGMLATLGVKLVDGKGRDVEPTPLGLKALAQVDASTLDPRMAEAQITIMSDVTNPLCGERGATAIFGPQKGVATERVAEIDATLARFAPLAERAIGRGVKDRPGAGAAGGLGFALLLLGGELRSGAEVVADLLGLDAALDGAHWLITGEGRTDRQTLLGKAPFVAARHAAARGVPVTLVSGSIDRSALAELRSRFTSCHALAFGPATLEECVANAPALLADTAEQLARLFQARAA
ncbi:MAG TPA: glycerate kinase [Casimicrobiaceae bacterium]|nr:glycerate kinase [Casimicrobiaceae bacterium]